MTTPITMNVALRKLPSREGVKVMIWCYEQTLPSFSMPGQRARLVYWWDALDRLATPPGG